MLQVVGALRLGSSSPGTHVNPKECSGTPDTHTQNTHKIRSWGPRAHLPMPRALIVPCSSPQPPHTGRRHHWPHKGDHRVTFPLFLQAGEANGRELTVRTVHLDLGPEGERHSSPSHTCIHHSMNLLRLLSRGSGSIRHSKTIPIHHRSASSSFTVIQQPSHHSTMTTEIPFTDVTTSYPAICPITTRDKEAGLWASSAAAGGPGQGVKGVKRGFCTRLCHCVLCSAEGPS